MVDGKPEGGFAPRMELPRPRIDGLKGRLSKKTDGLVVVLGPVIIHPYMA